MVKDKRRSRNARPNAAEPRRSKKAGFLSGKTAKKNPQSMNKSNVYRSRNEGIESLRSQQRKGNTMQQKKPNSHKAPRQMPKQPVNKPVRKTVNKQPVNKTVRQPIRQPVRNVQNKRPAERPKQKVVFVFPKNFKRNTGVLAQRLVVVVFIIISVYLIRGSYNMFSTAKSTRYEINIGTIDTAKSARAVVVRDEKVYKAPSDGVINYAVADNEKIQKGSLVCNIVDESVVEQRQKDLEEINQKILDRQKVRDSSVFSQSIQKVTAQIMTDIEKYSSSLALYDMKALYDLKSGILKKIDTRNQMFLNDNTGSVESLVTEKNAAQQEIDSHTVPVTAQEGGIVSYYVDGLENTFTVDKLSSLTYEQTNMDSDKGDEFKTKVSKDEDIFRIIQSNIWYVAAYIDNSSVETWKNTSGDPVANGDYVKVNIEGDNGESAEVQGTVKVFDRDKQNTYIVLEISKNMLDFIDLRSVTLEIDKEKEGYKIANTAIAEENLIKIPKEFVDEQESSIIKKKGDTSEKMIISISDRSDDGKYIYTPVILGVLNSGDTVIRGNDEYTITDELVVKKGVYMAHMGITQFIGINMEDSSSNASYTVISIEKNPSITIYDKIISDAKSVNNEEKYY